MTLVAHPVPGKAKSKMLCDAFIAGAPKTAKGDVFYGVKAGNHAAWREAQAGVRDWYFIDNSYFDTVRGTQFRVTKNRLQHTGWDDETTGERFAKLGLEIQPWQWNHDGHIVIVEQSPDHMNFVLTPKQRETYNRGVGLFERMRDRKLVHRAWSADKPAIQQTLARDLEGCWILYTHTSAAAVTATLAGIRTGTAPENAAWGVGYHDKREQWAGVLADNQFTIDELKDGTAWRKLNP